VADEKFRTRGLTRLIFMWPNKKTHTFQSNPYAANVENMVSS